MCSFYNVYFEWNCLAELDDGVTNDVQPLYNGRYTLVQVPVSFAYVTTFFRFPCLSGERVNDLRINYLVMTKKVRDGLSSDEKTYFISDGKDTEISLTTDLFETPIR